MGFLTPYFLCALFLFIGYLCILLCLWFHKILFRRRILRSGIIGKSAAAAYLATYFGTNTILTDGWFPYRTPFGTRYEEIPCILVLGDRVYVIEFCSAAGEIHNTATESWRAIYTFRSGRKKEIEFDNPIDTAEDHADILYALLDRLELPTEAQVIPLTVFTYPYTTFIHRHSDELCLLPEAVRRLKKEMAENHSTPEENRALVRALKKYSRSRRQAIAKNNSVRRKDY